MPYTATGYERRAEECAHLATLTRDETLKRGLLKLRQACLGTAGRLHEQAGAENVIDTPQRPNELAKLILKLRWMGMEEEAQLLQLAVHSLPPEQRGTVSAGPFSTD